MASTPNSAASITLAGHDDTGGLVIRDVESVHEYVDPRLSLSSRPSAHELDSSFSQKVSEVFHADHAHNHHAREHYQSKHGLQRGETSGNEEKDLEKGRDGTGVSTATDEILYVGSDTAINFAS